MIFEVAVGSGYCCRVLLSIQCSGDYVVDKVSVFQYWVIQRLMMQVQLMGLL